MGKEMREWYREVGKGLLVKKFVQMLESFNFFLKAMRDCWRKLNVEKEYVDYVWGEITLKPVWKVKVAQ